MIFGSFGLSTKEPYTILLCPSSLLALALVSSSSVHTSLLCRVRHGNFIFGIQMHIWPPQICTSYIYFKWQPFEYFSLICYPAHIGSHRDFISHVLKYLFFTYTYKRTNATVTYFLKFMSIILNSCTPYFSQASCALTYVWHTKAKFCTLS